MFIRRQDRSGDLVGPRVYIFMFVICLLVRWTLLFQVASQYNRGNSTKISVNHKMVIIWVWFDSIVWVP